MQELGLNQTTLALRCDERAQALFPSDQQPITTRVRFAKILMHCKAQSGKSAARAMSPQELLVVSSALNVSQERRSSQDNRGLVLWDPLADPARALRDYDSVSVCDEPWHRAMLKELQMRGSSRSGADAAHSIKALVRTIS